MSWPRIQICVAFELLIAVFQGSMWLLSRDDRATWIDHQRQEPADDVDDATDDERGLPLSGPLEGIPDDKWTERSTEIAECIHRAAHAPRSITANVMTHRPRRAE